MTCERCEDDFTGSRCHCGWIPPQLQAQAQWHTRLCLQCKNVMIRERVGKRGHEFCKWCNGDAAKLMQIEREDRAPLTRVK